MKTQSENEIRNYSKNWYTMGRSFLPEFETPQFASLAGNSTSFAYQINPKNSGTITVKLSKDVETAYVDLETQTIYISEKYFASELYNEKFDSPEKIEELAIALINGSTIHESLHIQHTGNGYTKNIPQILATDSDYELYKLEYGEALMCIAFNIAEDLYIDSQVPANLAQWLQNRAEILFPESLLEKMEVDADDLNDIINLMVYFKNKAVRDNDQFENLGTELRYWLDRLTSGTMVSQESRIRATFNIVDLLPKMDNDDGDSGDDGDGEAGDGESESSDGEPTADGEIPTELKSLLATIESLSGDEFESISSEMEMESDEIAESEMDTETDGILTWKKLLEEDVLKMRFASYGRRGDIEPTSKINFNFLKELQAIRTLNRTIGQARTRGSVMPKSRLTRIATDGKIFAKMDTERKTLKRIEVIINVDFSASTYGTVINNELGAAKEMSRVLKSARIAHSVYGHTSKGSDVPLLIHIFSYDMKTTNHDWENRFERAEHVTLSENYDGVIMAALREKFTGKNAMTYIINLSDGSPAGPGYHGGSANKHTSNEIEKCRKVGIGVFAISVVGHVVKSNDRIYGDANNIDGSKNVNAQFRNLIRKLVG